MCKILVQNFIIKDILKKKNDVHRISVRTIAVNNLVYFEGYSGWATGWLVIVIVS